MDSVFDPRAEPEGWMRGLGLMFASVPDPRAANARHDLSEVLFIAFAATLAGAETCADMAEFGTSKLPMLREVLALPHGVPSHDTFSRLFRLLDPEAFEAAFRRFTEAFAARLSGQEGLAGQTVAIDGKSLRGAFQAGAATQPLHLVTAWAVQGRLVLAQRRAPGRSEVTAARHVVALLDLAGATVTADALHGNRQMAAAIRSRGGDYALAIKGNRGPLHRAAVDLLAEPDPTRSAFTEETNGGRWERRVAHLLPTPPDWADRHRFEGLRAVLRVDATRRCADRQTEQRRYYALSQVLPPAEALATVRSHWSIENSLHWSLDVVLHEDSARSREGHAAENLALMRRLALNLLNADPSRGSVRAKIKRAGWHDAFLLSLIQQMR